MSTRTAVAVLLVLLLAASLALAADPYFSKPGAPAPAAKPVPAPAAATTPAPAPTEGAPAKDGEKPPTTTTPPAVDTGRFLGQDGTVTFMDPDWNTYVKPAWLVSPDADKVREIIRRHDRMDEDRAHMKNDMRRLSVLHAKLCQVLGVHVDASLDQLVGAATRKYDEAQQTIKTLYTLIGILFLGLLALGIWCSNLQKNKLGPPANLFPAKTEAEKAEEA